LEKEEEEESVGRKVVVCPCVWVVVVDGSWSVAMSLKTLVLVGLGSLVGEERTFRGEAVAIVVAFRGERAGVRDVVDDDDDEVEHGVLDGLGIVGSGRPRLLAMMEAWFSVRGRVVGYVHSLFCGVSPVGMYSVKLVFDMVVCSPWSGTLASVSREVARSSRLADWVRH
jgi:hypothetical protein